MQRGRSDFYKQTNNGDTLSLPDVKFVKALGTGYEMIDMAIAGRME